MTILLCVILGAYGVWLVASGLIMIAWSIFEMIRQLFDNDTK